MHEVVDDLLRHRIGTELGFDKFLELYSRHLHERKVDVTDFCIGLGRNLLQFWNIIEHVGQRLH